MLNITKEQRIETYQNSSDEIKDLYGDESLGRVLSNLIERFSISEEIENAFINVVGDVILGFHKIADLPQLLQKQIGVSADDSQRITSELIERLSPVVEREEQEAIQKKEEMNSLANTFAERKTLEQPTMEEQPETIRPIHTMNSDGNRVHGYGSLPENQDTEPVVRAMSQDETFQKKSDE